MPAITLINDVPSSVAPSAEFFVFQNGERVARVTVHAGGTASIPTTSSSPDPAVIDESGGPVVTAQQWQAYAIINGITTETVIFTNPAATVIAAVEADGGGFVLAVS